MNRFQKNTRLTILPEGKEGEKKIKIKNSKFLEIFLPSALSPYLTTGESFQLIFVTNLIDEYSLCSTLVASTHPHNTKPYHLID
jgi:hypothetical protein